MQSVLLDFSRQLKWQPMIEGGTLPLAEHYLLCGMGGSTLAGGLLTACDQTISFAIHHDYGLPAVIESSPLVIISSFSGNTEETIDAYNTARLARRPLVVITAGGELLVRARRDSVPLILLPNPAIPPRLAAGYFLKALALITRAEAISNELVSFADTFDFKVIETTGRSIGHRLTNRLPLIYSSNRYAALAYFWKIIMNETAKIPAFSDVVPEENHNELEGFEKNNLAIPFTAIMLTSADDDPRLARRFAVMTEILSALNIPVEQIHLSGSTPVTRVVNSVLLASFTALALAEIRQVDPDTVPIIEDFKRQLQGQ